MQTILVPTDFSENARNALAYAARLAKETNASLLLLHAYMLPAPVSEVPYMMANVEEIQKDNEQSAKDTVQKLQAEHGIRASYLVRLGFPSDEIQAVIEDQPIDLIIMGMKGKGTLEKWMGSTTTSTIGKVKIPVLVVPHDAVYKGMKQVTYATDFSYKVDFHTYKPLIDLIDTFQSFLHILHVQKASSDNLNKETAGEIQLDPAFSSVRHEIHIVEDKEVEHGIKSYIDKHQTDLLVMVSHEHGFLSRLFGHSHTKAMVYDTRVPLLVLKDK